MSDILWVIIISLIIFLLIFLFLKFYKGDKINKILIFLVGLTIVGAVTFFVCFPSDGKKWDDSNYFMGISQMVGGLFTVIGVYFTIKEEEKMRGADNENADNKIKEQLRLENLPVLKFRCDNENKSGSGVVYYVDCESDGDNYKMQLNIEIKNVGLGSAQNIWFQTIIGIENDGSKCGVENQIIEPKEIINHTMYFEIPKNNTDFCKRLTVLVFYDDLLENKYMQKLDGNISISCGESDGKFEYYPNASVSVNEKYLKIGPNFRYEVPQKIIEDEINRVKHEIKQKKILETVSNKDEIDEIVAEYLKNEPNFFDIVDIYFPKLKFEWGDGWTEDYIPIRNNVYDIIIISKVGINSNEHITCKTILRVNVKIGGVWLIDKYISESTLNINKLQLKKFRTKIKKEVKSIKKIESQIFK